MINLKDISYKNQFFWWESGIFFSEVTCVNSHQKEKKGNKQKKDVLEIPAHALGGDVPLHLAM